MKRTKQEEKDFLQLIQQHELLVFKVVNVYAVHTEDKKDLFQEIVLQAWHAYERFEGKSKASTWLYRVALNTAINHQRKKRSRPDLVFPEILLHHPAEQLDHTQKEQYKLLQQMIGDLPKLDKALILLYLEDKSYKEIAEIMGISASNVGTKVNRIKERLKKKAETFTN